MLRVDARGHGASQFRPAYTIAGIRPVTCSRCSTCWRSRRRPIAGSRSARWRACGSPRTRRTGSAARAVLHLGLAAACRRLAGPGCAGPAQGTASVTDQAVARWFTPQFRQRDPKTARWAAGMLAATPAEGYAACCEAIAVMDLRPDLAAISAPTLVIAGLDDPATPPGHGEAIAAAIGGADGAGARRAPGERGSQRQGHRPADRPPDRMTHRARPVSAVMPQRLPRMRQSFDAGPASSPGLAQTPNGCRGCGGHLMRGVPGGRPGLARTPNGCRGCGGHLMRGVPGVAPPGWHRPRTAAADAAALNRRHS